MTSKIKSTSDFSGAATLFLTRNNKDLFDDLVSNRKLDIPQQIIDVVNDNLSLDLLVTSISETIADHSQIDSYIGNIFSAHFFGKSPIILDINIEVLDSYGNLLGKAQTATKYHLMWLYSNLFGITGVAKYGVTPGFQVEDTSYYGAFLAINCSESATAENITHVNAKFLVFNRVSTNTNNVSGITSVEILYDESTYAKPTTLIADTEENEMFIVSDLQSVDINYNSAIRPGSLLSGTFEGTA